MIKISSVGAWIVIKLQRCFIDWNCNILGQGAILITNFNDYNNWTHTYIQYTIHYTLAYKHTSCKY